MRHKDKALRMVYPITIRHRLYFRSIPGQVWIEPVDETFDFTVRCVTRLEFQCWGMTGDELAFEEKLLEEAVISHPETFHGKPWEWDDIYAGVVEQVKQEVLKLSGFLGEPHPMLMDRVEKYIQGQDAKYDLMIMCAFPRYGLEDLMDMDNEMWHRLSGLAQDAWRLNERDPDMLLDPEKYEKKVRQQMAAANAQNPGGLVRGFPNGGGNRSIASEAALSFTGG